MQIRISRAQPADAATIGKLAGELLLRKLNLIHNQRKITQGASPSLTSN